MRGDMNDSFGKIIDRYEHFSKNMKSFKEALEEMSKSFKKFVEYYIEKRKK